MSLICCFLDTATPEIYTYCHPLSLHDALPISGDVQLSMIQKHKPADAVIISTPQDLALIDATRAVCLFEQADIPMIGLVENMAGYACSHCGEVSDPFGAGGAEAAAKHMGMSFSGDRQSAT